MIRCLVLVLTAFVSTSLEGALCYDEPLSNHQWSHFGPLCKHYVLGRKEKPDTVYEALKSYVNPDASVLDLGSGTGISTRQLFRHGFKNVIGVDRDSSMIKEALDANTDECRIRYIRADVSRGLPFPDEEFDLATAASSFHWFSNPSSIREVARILKIDGYYYIIGAQGLKKSRKNIDHVKSVIKEIYRSAGVPPKPHKHHMSTARALEAQKFHVVFTKEIPYTYNFSKQEFIEKLQSHSGWNLVNESIRADILKKINEYLETVVDTEGEIHQEGKLLVILAQKKSYTLTH